MDLSHPLFALDPFVADARAEAKRLPEAGPVVPVGVVGVPVRAVTRHAVAQQISEDPRFSTNSSNCGAPQRGEVPAGRPTRQVEALRPRIQRIVDDLLDRIAASPAHEATGLKEAFAVPLPMGVICELFGVPDEEHAPLHSLCHALFDTTEQPTEVTATEEALHRFMAELAASKAADPGDDLASMPVEHHTSGSLTNSLLALMAHPDEPARVRAGEASWEPVTMSCVAPGRDPAHHGPPAASFDVALPAFFDRFDAELALPTRDAVEPVSSPALNGVRALPVTIRPRQKAVAGG
ncbi:hypothetical protein [Streptomyces sp. NPDC088350]|uniref:hypothetical protein n=1 Tax=Streptomyces sp. NPDC088350 TaxID=3365854 RepID=UPI003828DC08